MRRIFNYAICSIVFLISASYIYLNLDKFEVILEIKMVDIFNMTIALLAFFLISGFTFKLLLDLLSAKLSLTETFGLSIITNFGNYLGPTRPGAAIKAIYLKKTKKLPYSKFVSILAANTFLAFFMTGIAGILLLLLFKIQGHSIPTILTLTCTILMFLSILPFVTPLPIIIKSGRIFEVIRLSLEGFEIIKKQKTKLVYICITFMVQFIFSAIIYKIAFSALGQSISLISALIIGVFTSIANLFAVTPNNVGIQEAATAYLFNITGADFHTGIVGASLVRIIHVIITFSLAPVFSIILLRKNNLSYKI